MYALPVILFQPVKNLNILIKVIALQADSCYNLIGPLHMIYTHSLLMY